MVLGNRRLLNELRVDMGNLGTQANALERQGRTLSWLVRQDTSGPHLLGMLAFGDTVKPTSAEAVASLEQSLAWASQRTMEVALAIADRRHARDQEKPSPFVARLVPLIGFQ